MFPEKEIMIDGGYGNTGNSSIYLILNRIKDPSIRKEYEKGLEKENPKQYKEYADWVKLLETSKDD